MAELDAGLAWDILQRYDDAATAEFDAVLAAADLDAETARALRFWQRESVAGIRHYAAHAIPAVLGVLAAAEADTRAAAQRAAEAWRGAHPDVPTDAARVVVLPDAAPPHAGGPGPAGLIEQRRRMVAARLTPLG